LETAFQHALDERGASEAIRDFKFRAPPSDRLPESFVNALGYQRINAKRVGDVVKVFVFNTEQHPDSGNV
jgi:hypothetical protein